MEVIEKSEEGLSRTFTVKVLATELDTKLTIKLEGIKDQVHLKGFRPGKAPVSFLKKMYGKGMMQELVQETMQEANGKALEERSLQPALPPHPHVDEETMDAVIAGKADLEYDLHVEVLPDVTPMNVAGLQLERMIADVPQDEIDTTLKELAESNRPYTPKKEGATIEDKDRVVVDFTGRVDDKEFEGGKGEGVALTVGSGQFIPGFEEQIIGMAAGEEKTICVTFPEDYGAKNLAGKEAEFDVSVTEISTPEEAALDDELAKKIGFDDLEALTKTVTERYQEELKAQSRLHMKRRILDQMDENHDFALPDGMVKAEFDQIWQQVQQSEPDEEDKDKSEEELKEEYHKIAQRRVRLGLVIAEIGKQNAIDVSQSELFREMQKRAADYQISVEELMQAYQKHPQLMAQLRAPLFEDKVIDYIIERAEISEVEVDKETLMQDPEAN